MSDNILVIAENNVNAGQLENLKALAAEMIATIKLEEPGTLNYELFIADDGQTVDFCERYADSDACMNHLMNLGEKKYAERLFACVTATKIVIYGTPSDAVRGVFAVFAPTYKNPFAGTVR